ncbi:MAG: MBL fold metallo-hydrolase [Anaerolineae bacterium]
MSTRPDLKQYVTPNGVKVYRLPVEAFPNHFTNCYLIVADDEVVLIDAASGWQEANRSLTACFDQLRDRFGESVTLAGVTTLLITHGHIDHFGGIHFVKSQSPRVKVGIHRLDARVVERIDERIIMSSKNLEIFLERAGVSPGRVEELSRMNKWSKDMFTSTGVDFIIDPQSGEPLAGLLTPYHTPGHCPGQVCLQLENILFSADHVLSRITPHQSPEAITRYTGLGHYLDSLRRIKQVPVELTLGGPEHQIDDLSRRVDEIDHFHQNRLEQTAALCTEPQTIAGISKGLFKQVSGYNVLLALLEAGAHVEYLYQRGQLGIANLNEVERERNPAILYRRL